MHRALEEATPGAARCLQLASLLAAGALLLLLPASPALQHALALPPAPHGLHASPLAPLDACQPRFIAYLPSALEASWGAHVAALSPASLKTHSFCGDIVSPAFREAMQAWVEVGAEQNAERPRTRDGLARQALALAARPDVFSRMVYQDPCTLAKREVHVSPLAGMLRDPRAPCALTNSAPYLAAPLTPLLYDSGRGETLQPKDTVIVDLEHVAATARQLAAQRAAGRTPKAILFDAGASTFNGESAGWPGTRWLVERYQDLGLNFTDIYAWEFTPRPGYEFFGGMPTELVAATHFYNFGASAQDGPQNPLSILKAVAQPGDFVVFKLDIDTPSVETPLVEALLADSHALGLITDFYYELHFNLQDMAWAWGHGEMGMDLASATAVFRKLREKGVKAQMWP